MKKDFLCHLLYAKNEHSLHSPFAFDLYNSVIKFEKFAFSKNEKITGLINRIIEKFSFQNNLFFDFNDHSIDSNQLSSDENATYDTDLDRNFNFLNSDPEINNNLFSNIKEIVKSIDNLDLACFNLKNHSNSVIYIIEDCFNKKANHSCFIFKEIYSSKQAKKYWAEIKNREEVIVTFDLYYLGLVFFNSELSKQNYRLRF